MQWLLWDLSVSEIAKAVGIRRVLIITLDVLLVVWA
jgi:hypothetical protein